MQLSGDQRDARNAIYNYGIANDYVLEDIQIALNVAYIESSIGEELTNDESSAYGLFQYIVSTWNDRHAALGSREDQGNQIQAFYNDLSNYKTRFANGKNNGDIPDDLDFPHYVYIKHHDGWNEESFDNAPGIAIYDNKIIGKNLEYIDVTVSGPYEGSLALYPGALVDEGVLAPVDVVGCIKYDSANYKSYIDYFLGFSLTDKEREDVVDYDVTDGLYIY